MQSLLRILVIGLIGLAPASFGAPQLVNKYGIDFCVIGDPGNRATNSTETPFNGPRGKVNHTYALSKTEISIGQWYEFVDAYGKYDLRVSNPTLTGRRGIQADLSRPSGWGLIPSAANLPAEVGWRYAAMYCNWLHNDRRTDLAAFQTGAYDVSTFGKVGGVYTDQVTRSPGAKFWLPSLDEWTKGAYWDPDRNGPGQGGYWLRPGGRDTLLTPGLPQNGGETSAFVDNSENLPVGSYSGVGGPWGVLDSSGSVREWTELRDPVTGGRSAFGSSAGEVHNLTDSIGWPGALAAPDFNLFGIRLATEVPSPSALVTMGFCALLARRRNR